MSLRHRVQEYVRWSDVDASSIIRWSAYPRFAELAETELFRAVGYPYATVWDRLDIWLPRVQAHFDYRSPARLDEPLDIDVWVGRIGRRSLRLEFTICKPGGELAAEGHVVMVAVDRKNGQPVHLPDPLIEALTPYVATPAIPTPSPPRGEGGG